MEVRRTSPRWSHVVLLASFGAALAAPAAGQISPFPRFGASYVANAPDLMGGIGGYVLFPALGGLGLYVDAKFDLDSPARDDIFIPTHTAQQVEDEIEGVRFINDSESWRSFNAALVRPLTPALMLYAGAGIATRKRYREYEDPDSELSELGVFLVEAPDEEWTTVNGLVGGFLRMSRWLDFQFGLETRPRGFTVGASLRLPPQ